MLFAFFFFFYLLQWFGNIVTMDWWDDLWLNEGFASFFEFLGVNAKEVNWQMVRISHLGIIIEYEQRNPC